MPASMATEIAKPRTAHNHPVTNVHLVAVRSWQFPAYCRYQGLIERCFELGDRPRVELRHFTGRCEQEDGARLGQHTQGRTTAARVAAPD
jgi:hypothetical protein